MPDTSEADFLAAMAEFERTAVATGACVDEPTREFVLSPGGVSEVRAGAVASRTAPLSDYERRLRE